MTVIESCVALISVLGKKNTLQEFELLAYEQACRVVEVSLKEIRENISDEGEFESYKE